jgi:hypothetical protein
MVTGGLSNEGENKFAEIFKNIHWQNPSSRRNIGHSRGSGPHLRTGNKITKQCNGKFQIF